MLNIDKSTVDFLVTETMAHDVEKVISRCVPEVKTIAGEMCDRNIKRLYFVCCGSPLNAAQTARNLAERYSDLPCFAYSGWEFLDNTPHVLDQRCAVVAISDSGTTEEVVGSLKLAQSRGAMTVAFSKSIGAPLFAHAERAVAYEASCIWEIHLLLCYTLVIEMTSRRAPHPEIERITRDIARLPQALKTLVVEWEEKGRALGERAASWPLVYTVAAGPLRPLAYKEGIVTLMEFAWTHGSVLESGEFRHGPLEVAEPGVSFLFLLGIDDSRHTTERAIRFVKKKTDNVIVVDAAELQSDMHPWMTPFLMFVPLEWFSYYLSLHKDHNPDDRRYYGGKEPY